MDKFYNTHFKHNCLIEVLAYRNDGTGYPCAGQVIAKEEDTDSENEFVLDDFGIFGGELPIGS